MDTKGFKSVMQRFGSVVDSDNDEEFEHLLLHTEGGCQSITPETFLFTV